MFSGATQPEDSKAGPPPLVLVQSVATIPQAMHKTYGSNKPVKIAPAPYQVAKKLPAPTAPVLVRTVQPHASGVVTPHYRVVRVVPSTTTAKRPGGGSSGQPVQTPPAYVRTSTGKIVRLDSDSQTPLKIVSRETDTQNLLFLNRGSQVLVRKPIDANKHFKATRPTVGEVEPLRMPRARTYERETEKEGDKDEKDRPKSPRVVNGVEDYLFGPSKRPRDSENPPSPEPAPEESSSQEDTVPNGTPQEIELGIPEADRRNIEHLTWQGLLGHLPGTDIKFKINEMGLLEVADSKSEKRENTASPEAPEPPAKKKKGSRASDDFIRCEHCCTYGMASEFIQQRFCGSTCLEEHDAEKKQKYHRLELRTQMKTRLKCRKRELLSQRALLNSVEASEAREVIEIELLRIGMEIELLKLDSSYYESDEDVQDRVRSNYMKKVLKTAAPLSLFKEQFPTTKNNFKIGMRLEAIDPVHPSLFCVCTVVEVKGHRLRLHFDGYPSCHDFWVNSTSPDIFQPGWCERTDHKLTPPRGYEGPFNWTLYLESQNATAAPRHAFFHSQEKTITPSGFRVGMKLEAVDKKNSRLVRVATVADVIENRILVHIDGSDDCYNYWSDNTSPYIHPAGWCEQNGYRLHPPPDWQYFNWEEYTAHTKSFTVPARAFKLRGPHSFQRGMRVEAVDKRNPCLIRIAIITDVESHQFKIKFDGWPKSYSYWVDDDNPDIHPIGWCSRARHPLTPPPRIDDVLHPSQCPIPGCHGIGHALGLNTTHHTSVTCPYSPVNFQNEDLIPDRFSSNAEYLCAKESSYSKGTKPRSLLSKKARLLDHKKPSHKKNLNKKSPSPPPKKNDEDCSTMVKVRKELEEYLTDLGLNPRAWTIEDVSSFVGNFLNVEKGKQFEESGIDGEALLLISQNDLTEQLSFKLGPAIKLYKAIRALREQALKCEDMDSPTFLF